MDDDFIERADTGDLLLMRSKQLGGKITRTFTNSDFGKVNLTNFNLDHVAMVLKFEQEEKEVFLLDATFQNGVSISRWSILKKYLIGCGKQPEL